MKIEFNINTIIFLGFKFNQKKKKNEEREKLKVETFQKLLVITVLTMKDVRPIHRGF